MTDGTDVRVFVKVQNAFIWRKMEERGIRSVKQLAEAIGARQSELGKLINMKQSALKEYSGWRSTVIKLSKFFGCLPEDLFSEQQQHVGLKKNVAHRDVSMDDIRGLIERGHEKSAEQLAEREDGLRVLDGLLHELKPRHQRVLELRFGLHGNEEHTLREVAEQMGLSAQTIRVMEVEALHKLKHKSRKKKIAPYLPDLCG